MSNKIRVLTNISASQNIIVSGSSIISGSKSLATTSSFNNAAVSTSSGGFYDMDIAIHGLDTGITTLKNNIKTAYNSIRTVLTGNLTTEGDKKINLTNTIPSGSLYFNTSSLTCIEASILIDDEDLNQVYKNDLVSLQLYNSASCLWVQIEAAAAGSDAYRLILVNHGSFPINSNAGGSSGGNNTNTLRQADFLLTFSEVTMPVTGTNYNNDPVYWFENTGRLAASIDEYGAIRGTPAAAVPLALPLYQNSIDGNGGALFVSGAYARLERQAYGLTPQELGSKFTLSMWIKPTNPNSYYQSILGYTNNNSIYCSVANNKCKINYYFNGNDHLFATEFNLNQWTQVVLSYENNILKAYINGVLDSTTINISPQDMLDIRTIGNNGSGGENFTGYIAQLKIWFGDAFTASEISQIGF